MSTAQALSSALEIAQEAENMYVTMRIENQLFGVVVKNVRDVLREQKVTPIPMAPNEVAGSLNLRGRIVTVIDLRKRLRLQPKTDAGRAGMFVVVEYKNELFSLMVDSVGEVLTASAESIEKTPANLSSAWKDVASGIYKLDGELLVIMDIGALLSIQS